MTGTILLCAGENQLRFEPDCGYLTDLRLSDQGQAIMPLHKAQWLGEAMPGDAPRHQARLQGDFIAAPFGPGALGLHGAANGQWQLTPSPEGVLRAVYQGEIQGASLVKELSFEPDQPFLYQRHLFIGGSGSLAFANHAMVALTGTAKLSFSRKRWFETLDTPLEADPSRGRSALKYPARMEDGSEFPGADGGAVNLHHYPWGEAHEDFVAAVEEPASPLGWTAVVRLDQGDVFLSLRNPRQLPMTMLWHSNGGRDYAPWNGRHRGCLGVEEGAALPVLGLSSRESPDPLSAAGQAPLLQLEPQGTRDMRHILGAIRWPSGQAVAGVRLEGDLLTVTGDWGAERQLPIRGGWLAGASCS